MDATVMLLAKIIAFVTRLSAEIAYMTIVDTIQYIDIKFSINDGPTL
jgi:hypothetical protein